MNAWGVLGIAPTSDRAAIRRAYAKALRVTNPEDDPEGFKALRTAYETALTWADNAALWEEEEDEEDDGDAGVTLRFSEAELFHLIDSPDAQPPRHADLADTDAPMPEPLPGPRFRSGPAEPESAAPEPEFTAMLGERETEIATLNALLGRLEAALRSPWENDEEAIRDTFSAILAVPVMGEIGVHGDVEAALAAILAATIPRSDVILPDAIAAFGWSEDRAGRMPPPVAAVLERLDEWRIIEGFSRHGHPLHPAWRSLTRPAGAWWSWRIEAFRPGMESGVATLLGERGEISPGLAFSFKADSVARWRRFLGRPHWTLGMFTAVPLTALLYLVLSDAFGDPPPVLRPWADWAIGLGIVLSPWAPFLARRLRARWLARPRPRWLAEGWIFGLGATLLGAILLPTAGWALGGLTVASGFVWFWMAVAGGPASYEEVRARLRASWLTILLCAFFGGVAGMIALDPVHRGALALMLALGAALMVGPLAQPALPLARLPRWRAGFAAPLVLFIGAIAFAATSRTMPGAIFYAAALTTIAGFTVLALARLGGVRSNREHAVLRLTKMALAGAFVFAALVALDDTHPQRGTGTAVSTQAPAAEPTLHDRVATALAKADDPDRAVRRLRDEVIGFDEIARGNPPLMAKLESTALTWRQPRDTDGLADRLIDQVAAAYAQQLPSSAPDQLMEEIDIRRLRLKTLRDQSAKACVTPRTVFDEVTLPVGLRDRQTAQTFNIAANPVLSPAELAAERPYPPVTFNAMVTRESGLDLPAFQRITSGKAGDAALCDARIALLTALVHAPDRTRAAATARRVLFGQSDRP